MKYFRMSYEEVVFHRSYLNIMLLNKSIPSYNTDIEEIDDFDRGKTRHKYKNDNDFFMQFM